MTRKTYRFLHTLLRLALEPLDLNLWENSVQMLAFYGVVAPHAADGRKQ